MVFWRDFGVSSAR